MDERPGLERPPGDRYRPTTAEPRAPDAARVIVGAAAISLAAAGAIAVLGGILAVDAGLIVVAALAGWLIATSLRTAGPVLSGRTRRAVAVTLAVDAVVLGQVGLWLIALAEGGVLDPLTYLGQVFGLLVPLELLAALVAAAWTAR